MPEPAAILDEHDALACMAFQSADRTRLHSTNPLERLHGELQRRIRVVGILPD